MSPAAAIAKLRREAAGVVLSQLERAVTSTGFDCRAMASKASSGSTRGRCSTVPGSIEIRAAIMSVLFDHSSPDPAMAALISLLHTVDGLSAVLSLNERAWEWVLQPGG